MVFLFAGRNVRATSQGETMTEGNKINTLLDMLDTVQEELLLLPRV